MEVIINKYNTLNQEVEINNVSNKKVAVKLQYDANSVTTTSMKVRFYGWTVDGVNYLDSFYILYNPTSSDRTLYLLKYYYGKGY